MLLLVGKKNHLAVHFGADDRTAIGIHGDWTNMTHIFYTTHEVLDLTITLNEQTALISHDKLLGLIVSVLAATSGIVELLLLLLQQVDGVLECLTLLDKLAHFRANLLRHIIN